MQYRRITKNDLKVSALGFGAMRFPVENGDNCKIIKDEAQRMLQRLYEGGVNYFDTAYVYHCETSEAVIGEFLKTVPREEVYVASKLPMWLCKEHADYNKLFEVQLERLQTDYIDFYLTHSLTKKSFDKMVELDVFKFLDLEKEKGRIRYAGFSFHDDYEVFVEILESYPWDFCQIQLNYMDVDYQAGLKGLQKAKELGIDVIVMEPIKGGNLAQVPDDIQALFDQNPKQMSPAEWAQRWVYSQPDVSLLLSGMSNMEQVEENLKIAATANEYILDERELSIVEKAKELFEQRVQVGCTSCEYCMPCPFNVNIPEVFDIFNNASVYGRWEVNRNRYEELLKSNRDATQCTECGQCEGLCPQHLSIIEDLKRAHKAMR